MSDKLLNKYKRLFNKLDKVEEDKEVAHIVQDEIYRKFIKDIANNKIKIHGYVANPKSLINIYDNHNITVLPSYTEATPSVVDESLSRKRPVIIFEDIEYIVREKKGIFISKRDTGSFSNTAKYIIDHYKEIQKEMEENKLATKKSMIKQISDIIKTEN